MSVLIGNSKLLTDAQSYLVKALAIDQDNVIAEAFSEEVADIISSAIRDVHPYSSGREFA